MNIEDINMNTAQRVGFIYRVIEDQQKDHPITPLEMKNLTHYADTGEWLNEEIIEFEKFRKDKKTLEELHEKALCVKSILNEDCIQLLGCGFYENWDEELKELERWKEKVEKLHKELAACYSEFGKDTEYANYWQELKEALDHMTPIEGSRRTAVQMPDGLLYYCDIRRVGAKLVLVPIQKMKGQ